MILAILRVSHLAKLALAGVAVGGGFLAYAAVAVPPARDALAVTEGKLVSAGVVTRTSQRSRTTTRHFELMVQPIGGGAEARFRIPERAASAHDIRAAIGQRVRAEHAATDDVFVLAAGGREIVGYAASRDRRASEIRQYEVDGVAILGGSLVVLLVAGGFAWRRLRRQVSGLPVPAA